ncbi:1,2-phenylacetyl-CoA epoxidase subunit PaaC [Zoogloea sp.]|uniref:1,2-phenylacetyl-CoA epoxidase subunit PaaC n=1 Tax=Zoogloea sp. TaxID=49181 RepID=UPI0035B13F32
MSTPIDYLLHLADNAVVLGQRNAEWCGHGPILEEDLALANVSLDLIGQARLLYQRAAELMGGDATEDKLAYFRDAHEFRNYTLLELPHHGPLVGYAAADRDYATTIVRNFLYSTLMVLVWDKLLQSKDASLAAIAAKSLKEASYHLHHSRDWLVRLGDGTEESHARVQAAVNHLMPYTEEFWTTSPAEGAAVAAGVGIDVWALRPEWDAMVNEALEEATLTRPNFHGYVTEGKVGLHSEHLSYLLGEMQGLARAHPNATW